MLDPELASCDVDDDARTLEPVDGLRLGLLLAGDEVDEGPRVLLKDVYKDVGLDPVELDNEDPVELDDVLEPLLWNAEEEVCGILEVIDKPTLLLVDDEPDEGIGVLLDDVDKDVGLDPVELDDERLELLL